RSPPLTSTCSFPTMWNQDLRTPPFCRREGVSHWSEKRALSTRQCLRRTRPPCFTRCQSSLFSCWSLFSLPIVTLSESGCLLVLTVFSLACLAYWASSCCCSGQPPITRRRRETSTFS